MVDDTRTELLFSYGTLQLPEVQMSTFGRLLAGSDDVLRGFELVPLPIDDEKVIAISGTAVHTMARFTGRMSRFGRMNQKWWRARQDLNL